MSSEIMVQLGLNESRFEQGLNRGTSKWRRWAQNIKSDQVELARGWEGVTGGGFARGGVASKGGGLAATLGGTLGRMFNPAALLKGALGFAGIGTALALIDKLSGAIAAKWSAAEETAKKIAEFTERTRKALREGFESSQTPQQRLAQLQGRGRVLNRQLGFLRDRDDLTDDQKREEAGRLSAEIAENQNATAEAQKKVDEEAKSRAEEIAKVHERVEEARRERLRARLSIEDQIAASVTRQDQLSTRFAALANDPLKQQEALLEIEKERTEEERLRAELQERTNADARAAAQEDAQRNAERRRLEQEEIAAQHELAEAEDRLNAARAARTEITLGDAVAGSRGTPTERARARAIANLEKRAQRARDAGGDFRDASGKTMSASDYAQSLFNRAEDMRNNLGPGFAAADKFPFQKMQDDIAASRDHLQAIEDSLKQE
jgi:chromosome segregation ATPase